MTAEQSLFLACFVALASAPAAAQLDIGSPPEHYSLHAQTAVVVQYHPAFRSLYRGANSLDPGSRGDETVDLTVFAGVRMWRGVKSTSIPRSIRASA
jgi:high affinity Mn2+ porin